MGDERTEQKRARNWPSRPSPGSKRVHPLLDVGDRLAGVEVLRARLGAVHDRVTPLGFSLRDCMHAARRVRKSRGGSGDEGTGWGEPQKLLRSKCLG